MTTTSPEVFVQELETLREKTLQVVRTGRHGRLSFGDRNRPPQERPEVVTILKLLMYPERRVGDVLATRLSSIPDADIKVRVAQQIFEEIHHARLLCNMLDKWGCDPDEHWLQPMPELVEIFNYIETLETLSEFFSTFLIGEGLFLTTYLDDMQVSDPHAFSPYLEAAAADEASHIQLARDALLRYATTAELQVKTRQSAERLLRMFLGGYEARVREFHLQLARSGAGLQA